MIDITTLPDKAPQFDLRELFNAGMHYGHHKSKWHPRMAQFIHSEKDGVHIIDLAKTAEQMRLAYNLVYHFGSEGKVVIIVGTKRQARELVRSAGEDSGLLHITSRWLGGLMTNWAQVKKSIKHMVETESKLADGTLTGRTKYEIVQIEKEVARAKRFFDGVRTLNELPAALIVLDPQKEKIAVAEAEKVGIPVIALVDTNTNPDEIDLVIPGNDDAVKSIEYFLQQMAAAYKAGKSGGKSPEKSGEKSPVAAPAAQQKELVAANQPAEKTPEKVEPAAAKTEEKVTEPEAEKPVEESPAAKKTEEKAPAAPAKAKPAKKAAAKGKKTATKKTSAAKKKGNS